jgi:serine/threonine protein kinase
MDDRVPEQTATDDTHSGFRLPERIGPFLVRRLIGQGGMGAVYEAVHERLGRPVALKILPAQKTVHPEYHARFEREAKLVGRLNHANVVQATDAGTAEGVPYLAMELVDGIDISKLVRTLGPFSVADAAEVARQAAAGLAHIHTRGVIHRDIKPSNLMITADGTVKLLDLGLAYCAEAFAGSGQLTGATYLGTQDYMAPEQWDDPSRVDDKADLYGLGCVLFQMLAGRSPFAGRKTATLKLKAHLNEPPPDLAQVRNDIPPMLAALVQRLLAKHPVERPSAGELLAELAGFAVDSNLPRLVERGRLGTGDQFDDGAPTQALPGSNRPLPVPALDPAPVRANRAASLVLWAMVMSMFAAAFVVGLILIFRQKG